MHTNQIDKNSFFFWKKAHYAIFSTEMCDETILRDDPQRDEYELCKDKICKL